MMWKKLFSFLVVCTGNLLAAASYTMANPIYPSEGLSRGVSVSKTGVVLGSAYVTGLVITPFCSKLISNLGARKVYAFGSFIGGIGNVLFGFLDYISGSAEFFWFSLIFRSIGSLGETVVANASYPLGTKLFSDNERGKVIATMDCFYGFGTAIGPSLGSFLFNIAGGFTLPFWTVGIIMIMLGGLLLLQDFNNEIEGVGLVGSGTCKWKDLITCPGMFESVLVLVVSAPAQKWISSSLEPHLKDLYGISTVDVGLINTALAISAALANPIVGIILDFGFSSLNMILVGNCLTIIGLIGIGPVPGLAFLQTIPVVLISLALIGIGLSCIFLATILNMMDCAAKTGIQNSEKTTSMITSLWLQSNYIGAFLSSLTGGVTYDLIGFSWSCTVLATIITFVAFGTFISSMFTSRRFSSYEQI